MNPQLTTPAKKRLHQTAEDILLYLQKKGSAYGSEILKDLNSRRRWKRITHFSIYDSLTKLGELEMIHLTEKKTSWNQPDRKYYGLTSKGEEEAEGIKEYRKAIGG